CHHADSGSTALGLLRFPSAGARANFAATATRSADMSGSDAAADVPARVIESFGRRVTVATPDGTTLPAELFGKRLNCVCGNNVTIRLPSQQSGDVAKVISVTQRHTLFARTESRGRTEPL